MSGFPYIFTFYSFKGGVGRSMALLNTAYALASWGRHVLIVDMDLEAPGVSGFLHRHKELASPQTERTLDVLTLLGEVVSATRAGKKAREIADNLPPLPNYVRSVASEKLDSLKPRFGTIGRLDVVAADMNRDWCQRLADLKLSGLPQDRLIEISSALHFYFKAHRFPHKPLGLEEFDAPLSTPYDYVLVDSRTGITDVGGLCVGPLADRLVVLSSLNDQNIQGTLTFLKEAGIEPKPREENAERWDDADTPAETEAPTLGPKPTLLVASPVPNGEIDFKKARLNELEKRIGIRPSRLSYHPQMALMETIFVRDHRDEYLAREYFQLAERITRQAADHPTQFWARSQRRPQKLEAETIEPALRVASMDAGLGFALLAQVSNTFEASGEKEIVLVRRLLATLAEDPDLREDALNNWANALWARAKQKTGAEADRLFAAAGEKYAEALRIKPDGHEALYNWGNALSDQAKQKTGAEADRLFAVAAEKYAEALRIKPDKHEALYNWGNALWARAKQKTGAEADRLFAAAGEKYAEALRIKPDDHEVLNNWGVTLWEQAKEKTGAEADRLFAAAGEKYAEALRIKPDKHEALYNWGNALWAQAKQKTGAEADRLFGGAGEKYAEALRIKPDLLEALNNWGAALSDQAKQKTEAEADRLFSVAGEKYAEALRIKPDLHEALNNWGNALSARGKQKTGAEADRLFSVAGEKYAEALRIKPDLHEALNNWGNALSARGKQKTGAEADRLFAVAGEKYAKALRIKPDGHEALNNWGNALSDQAKQKTGAEADRLFAVAGEKYAEALRIKPDKHDALNNWGTALSDQAKQKTGAEADRLFAVAGEKYAEALRIKPDLHDALNNWGAALSDQAKQKTGAEADRLYAEARNRLLKAESLQTGSASYNLACIEALCRRAPEAVGWLQKALATGEVFTEGQLADDADFDAIRNEPLFVSFVSTLKSK